MGYLTGARAACPVCGMRCAVEVYGDALHLVTCENYRCAMHGKTGVGRSVFDARQHLGERAKGAGLDLRPANDDAPIARAAGG